MTCGELADLLHMKAGPSGLFELCHAEHARRKVDLETLDVVFHRHSAMIKPPHYWSVFLDDRNGDLMEARIWDSDLALDVLIATAAVVRELRQPAPA